MTVYVVTTGSYDEYGINKLFTDRNRAEEYASWLPYANEIEEYDLDTPDNIIRCYKVYLELKVVGNNQFPIHSRVIKDCCISKTDNWQVFRRIDSNSYEVCLMRKLPAAQYDEDKAYKICEDYLYQIAAFVEQQVREGASTDAINMALKNMEV